MIHVSRIAVLLFALSVVASNGDETNALPTTIEVGGIVYSNVTWKAVTTAGVSISHRTGVATIPPGALSPALQRRFGYDKLFEEAERGEKLRGTIGYLDYKNGFRDLTFGQPPSKGMWLERFSIGWQGHERGISVYKRDEDQLGGAILGGMEYVFYKNRLMVVGIDQRATWDLRKVFEQVYGPGEIDCRTVSDKNVTVNDRPVEETTGCTFIWRGKKVEIYVDSGGGFCHIKSLEIVAQMEADEKALQDAIIRQGAKGL